MSASLMGGGSVKTELAADGKSLVLSVPQADQKSPDTVIRLDVDGPAMEIAPLSLVKMPAKVSASVYS